MRTTTQFALLALLLLGALIECSVTSRIGRIALCIIGAALAITTLDRVTGGAVSLLTTTAFAACLLRPRCTA